MSSLTNSLLSFGLRRIQKGFERRDVVAAEKRGEKFAVLAFKLDRKHRERAISNLMLAYPDLTLEAAHSLALETFRHFGRITGDFLRSPARSDDEVLASVEGADLTPYKQAASKGKGVLGITGHMGNFERLAHWYQANGYDMKVVARDANDAGLQEQVAGIRGGRGMIVLSRGNSARTILQSLRENGTIGLLPDQNTDECFVPFFGKQCGTTLGPAVLHLRTGAPLVPGYCIRTGPGKYKIEIFEPMEYSRSTTEPEQIMADLNAVLESVIRKYPEQWLWLHDRWKSARRAHLL